MDFGSLPIDCYKAFVSALSPSLEKLNDVGYKVLDTPELALKHFIEPHNTFIFDIDGVLQMGTKPLSHAAIAISILRKHNKRILFLTNTACKSRKSCLDGLHAAGIPAFLDEVITGAYAGAAYIAKVLPDVKKVLVVGEVAIAHELAEHGIDSVLLDECPKSENYIESEADFVSYHNKIDPDVGAVLMGWDRYFSFHKACAVSLYLQVDQGRLPFIATNLDMFSTIHGLKIPANGAFVACVQTATGREPICVGKPTQWLAEMLKERHQVDYSSAVMIGDRMDTDILFGKVAKTASTALVLSGCTPASLLLNNFKSSDEKAPSLILPHVGILSTLE